MNLKKHFASLMILLMMVVCPSILRAQNVAEVTIGGTTTQYTSFDNALAAAMAASDPATIKLLADISKAGNWNNPTFEFKTTTAKCTIDLNNKTILSNGAGVGVIVVNGAEVTITDGSSEKGGKVETNQWSASLIYKSGKLTIEGGTFKGNGNGLKADKSLNDGDLTLHGGTFIANNSAIELKSSSDYSKLGMADYIFVDGSGTQVTPNQYSGSLSKPTVSVVSSTLTEADAAASIVVGSGTPTLYRSVSEALADTKITSATAASSTTLKLLKDITMEAKDGTGFTLSSGEYVFDLNGKTVSMTSVWNKAVYVAGAKVTITDNSQQKTGKIAVESGNGSAIQYNSGKLTILEGTFVGIGRGLKAENSISSGKIILHGGTFTGQYAIGLNNVNDYNNLDMDAYVFVDEDNNTVTPTTGTLPATTVTVKLAGSSGGGGTEPSDPVASVIVEGSSEPTNYPTFNSALVAVSSATAASKTTLKLLKNVTFTGNNDRDAYQLSSGTYTLDLNGCKIKGAGVSNYTVININGADVTFVDSSEEKSGTVVTVDYAPAVIYKSGKLTINGGTFQGKQFGLKVSTSINAGDVTLHGGTFKGDISMRVQSVADYDKLGMDDYYFCDNSNEKEVIPTSAELQKSSVTIKSVIVSEADAVASVTKDGETKYLISFTKALEKASAGTSSSPATLTLLKNVNYSNANWSQYAYQLTSGTYTMDLNGKTIKVLDVNNSAVAVKGANVTFVDNSSEGTGKLESGVSAPALSYESGKLTILGGTFKSYLYGLKLANVSAGNVTLRGGTFTGQKAMSAQSVADYDKLGMVDYRFVDSNNNEITPTEGELSVSTVTIKLKVAKFNSKGLATFSASQNMKIITEGVKAYKASVEGTDINLTPLTGYIPAGCGVILYNGGSETQKIAKFAIAEAGDAEADISGNVFIATTKADGSLAAKADYTASSTVYSLGTENVFLIYSGSDFIHHRAFLTLPSSNSAKSLRFVFLDGATGIKNVNVKETASGKFIENGKLVIIKNNMKYNASGIMIK